MFVLRPIAVEKPWGVTPHLAKWSTGIHVSSKHLIGELWIASGLKSIPDAVNKVADSNETISDIIEKNPGFLGDETLKPVYSGKAEAWYVRDVKGNVRTITGLREGIGKDGFLRLIKDGYFEKTHSFDQLEQEVFATEAFKRHAFYVMLPGTLHAIYAPNRDSYVVVDEIQQGYGNNALPILSKILFITNSELSVQVHPSDADVAKEKSQEILDEYSTEPTVRVYDFGRGRNVQPELAASIIRYGRKGFIRTQPATVEMASGCRITYLGATKFFARELIELRRGIECKAHDIGNKYCILHCLDGEGMLHWDGGDAKFSRGMTLAVPAYVKSLSATTKHGIILYRDYQPDLALLKHTLKSFGISDEEISNIIVTAD